MELKFENVTISGGVAVGKSTLENNLNPYLQPLSWKFKSVGDMYREHLKDNIMPEAVKTSDQFDKVIEAEVFKMLSTESNHVVQAWISGFVARELSNTLRVLLICKDNSLRVDRVANRDALSVQQAKEFIKRREEGNINKYRRLYGEFNFWDPQYYHLVIDTYAYGQIECVDLVLQALGYKK